MLIAVNFLLVIEIFEFYSFLFFFSHFYFFHFAAARAKKLVNNTTNMTPQPTEHRSTARRNTNVSQSQRKCIAESSHRLTVELIFIFLFCAAASRSTSPSSSKLYSLGYQSAYKQTGTIPKKTPSSVIPRSLVNSRETSPTRTNNVHHTIRRLGYMPTHSPRRQERPPIIPSRPVLAQKMLNDSREAEKALADALVISLSFLVQQNRFSHFFLR